MLAAADDALDIATPLGSGFFLTRLLSGQPVPAAAARTGAALAAQWGRPFRFGRTVVAVRHSHVRDLLSRDLDFRIGPINGTRINEVNGAFVLGMDRCPALSRERDALYRALAAVDVAPLRAAAAGKALSCIAAASRTLDVVEAYARPVAAATARRLFGLAEPAAGPLMDAARAIFAHTFLNIGSDKAVARRALAAAALLRGWLAAEVARRRATGALGADMMGALLRDGTLDDDGVRRTLGGMLVGSIDTTASAVAKIAWVASRDDALRRAMAADAGNEAAMAGWCHEALRLWPHNPVLLRQAARDTALAGTTVRAGDTVVAWTQAAMQDAEAFPEPRRMKPDRPAAAYLHFGGGLHPCAGRAVNAWQIPLLVGALVQHGPFSAGAVQWAGPFPAHLSLTWTQRGAA